jgi:tRNA/rRNA methyltransferase
MHDLVPGAAPCWAQPLKSVSSAHSTRTTVAPVSPALERIRVVLCATSHPGNIGAAARAMHTMGLAKLALVAPLRFPHPDADALAAGGVELLRKASVHDDLDAALAGTTLAIGFSARPREFAVTALAARAAAIEAVRCAAAGDVALVFGGEMSGLSNEELSRCQIVATIPGAGAASLNLAAAVQVAAYEVFLAANGDRVWTAPAFAPATQEEIALLFARAEQTLAAMRFLDLQRPKRLLPRLRRLFARARLEREEVNILRGILARIDQLVERAGPWGGKP